MISSFCRQSSNLSHYDVALSYCQSTTRRVSRLANPFWHDHQNEQTNLIFDLKRISK